MEVHHIVPSAAGGSDDLDNAIPLCFDCHSNVGHYDDTQPRGTKIKPDELVARREQVYEEFTRHLVPPIHYEITNILSGGQKRVFPDVGFNLTHYGDSLPVRIRTVLEVVQAGRPSVPLSGHYSGGIDWQLNPRFAVRGHFALPSGISTTDLKIRVQATIIDQYEREHAHLPVVYSYSSAGDYWYFGE